MNKGDVEVMGFIGGVTDGGGAIFGGHTVSFDFNGHYLFPSTNTPGFTAYVLAGIGYVRATANASVGGTIVDASASDTGLNIGAGARWQPGSNWGIKPEIKILIADGSSVRFAVGIYRR